MKTARRQGKATPRVLSARHRAKARNRALARLAREHPERYAQLYAEERGASSR